MALQPAVISELQARSQAQTTSRVRINVAAFPPPRQGTTVIMVDVSALATEALLSASGPPMTTTTAVLLATL